jgi:cell division protein FtsB
MLWLRPSRVLALGALVLLGFLYWKPAHTYVAVKRQLDSRNAEVRSLQLEQTRLERRIAEVGSNAQLVREARRLGLVKPGERLFIVKGIPAWRKKH